MKLFLYTSVLSGGGAERVLCQLANNFLKKKHDVFIIASYPTQNEYVLDNQIKKIYIDESNQNKKSIRQILRLRALVKKEKPDVLISFLPNPNLKMLIATMGLTVKKVISVRNDPNYEYANTIIKILAKVFYLQADGIVFQTKQAQKWFSKKIQKKSVIIMNQVSELFFSTKRVEENFFVAVGRLNKQKNYPLMIKAFGLLVKEHPNVRLRIYGDGEEKENINNLIKKYKLENNISLMGKSNHINEVLSHAKAFVLSSTYEGMPNALLEAMAMGLPCIATDCPCGGPEMIIKNGYNGVLVPVDNINSLYEGLKKILENDEFRIKIALNAKESSKNFYPQKIFREWEEYIFDIEKT